MGVRSFSREQHEVKRDKERIMNSYGYGVKRAWAYGFFIGGLGLAAYMAVALVLWYGGREVINGNGIKDDGLIAFLLYTIQIAAAIGGLSGLYSSLMQAVGASERMFALIDRVPAINSRSR